MLTRLRTRATCENVVATLALFLALGGSAYAAATIGAANIKDNAIHSNHIADGQVKNQDLAPSSIGGGKVIDGSLLARDFKAGQAPRGEPGPPGPGAIKFDRTDPETTVGTTTERIVNGVFLEMTCRPEGAYYFIDDEIVGSGGGGPGVGVVGTQQMNSGTPLGVHTGGPVVQFGGSNTVDVDVMAQSNNTRRWTEFKLFALHRSSQHNCSFGGTIIPST
jgi:hypothetical protein